MDFSGLCIILKKRPFCLIEKNSRVSFLYFFSLFLYLVEIYENENNELETHYLEVIRKFLYGYLWLTCFNVFFKNIAK